MRQGIPNFDYSAKANGFEFKSTVLDAMSLRIRFEFDKSGYRDFCFGFVDDGKLPTDERELLKSLFADAYGSSKSSPTWPAWLDWEQYQNWCIREVFTEIRFGNFVEAVEGELTQLNKIAMKFYEARRSNTKNLP